MLAPSVHKRLQRTCAVLCLALVTACSSIGPHNVKTAVTAPTEDNNPSFNAMTSSFNKGFDKVIMRPAAKQKGGIIPKFIRDGVGNFIKNLYEPWTAINEMMQFNFKGAAHTTKRFVVNTSMGLGGLFDTATKNDILRHKEDFGQTLAVWGVKPGSYLVIPFLGPSNVRDTFGFMVDVVADPVSIFSWRRGKPLEVVGRTFLNAIEFRTANYNVISEYIDRPDSYDRLKLFYEQTRAYQIRNGLLAPDAVDDLFVDDELECYPADEALEGDVICEE